MATAEPKLKPNQRTVFQIIFDAGPNGLTMAELNDLAREAGIGLRRKADLHDIRTSLFKKGMIRESGGRWFVQHT